MILAPVRTVFAPSRSVLEKPERLGELFRERIARPFGYSQATEFILVKHGIRRRRSLVGLEKGRELRPEQFRLPECGLRIEYINARRMALCHLEQLPGLAGMRREEHQTD